jgi:hypothetical protein
MCLFVRLCVLWEGFVDTFCARWGNVCVPGHCRKPCMAARAFPWRRLAHLTASKRGKWATSQDPSSCLADAGTLRPQDTVVGVCPVHGEASGSQGMLHSPACMQLKSDLSLSSLIKCYGFVPFLWGYWLSFPIVFVWSLRATA